MTTIHLKYNPYQIQTKLLVNDKPLKGNTDFQQFIQKGGRLQNWIEDFPEKLSVACSDNQFDITFFGTEVDFTDVQYAFSDACNGALNLNVNLNHVKGEEVADKELKLEEVFRKIQQGPFDEFRAQELKDTFEIAKGKDYEVCVVATMSAGKSTLINSLLRYKLMPSKQEACTAIITKIRDNSDKTNFSAKAYDANNQFLKEDKALSLQAMGLWNEDSNVETIEVEGNIPFVKSDETSLVLIDTPGPNNARNDAHGELQDKFLNKDSKALILYVMTGEFGTEDDKRTLSKVADAMKVGGKQSKDRFIFVVNKLDGRSSEDGDVSGTLKRVREYLENEFQIYDANLFPASALTALDIRRMDAGTLEDALEVSTVELKVQTLNLRETMHFEKFSSIPRSLKAQVESKLSATQAKYAGGTDGKNTEEALIHTGIPSVELAIEQYVEKYAKTDKIKALCDTFTKKLDASQYTQNLKGQMLEDEEKCKEIQESMAKVQKVLDRGDDAKAGKEQIQRIATQSYKDFEEALVDLQLQFTQKVVALSREVEKEGKMERSKASRVIRDLNQKIVRIQKNVTSDVKELVKDKFAQDCENILANYQDKLKTLIEKSTVGDFKLDISTMMGDNLDFSGSIEDANDLDYMFATEKVKVGEKWEKREKTFTEKFKFWDWGKEYGTNVAILEDREYIQGSDVAEEICTPLNSKLLDFLDATLEGAEKQNQKMVGFFNDKFDELDQYLSKQMEEMQKFSSEKADKDKKMKDCAEKLEWLQEIRKDIENILSV